MRSLKSLVRQLDVRFAAVLSLPLVACGGTTTEKDASTDLFPDVGCPGPQSVTIHYRLCADASSEAGDASTDAGDAGACVASCSEACRASVVAAGYCASQSEDGGVWTAQCQSLCGMGRRPDGLCDEREAVQRGVHVSGVGGHFAIAAWMEAASVRAFERLARELEAHGAPKALIREAKRAARDEVRHARAMARLARSYGAHAPRVRVRSGRVRSLERIARENAVEGCVGETFGALVLRWQAERTTIAPLKEALARIAPDETRHAALSLAIDAWIQPKLDPKARMRIARARRDAERTMGARIKPTADASLGLPDRAQGAALANALFSV